MLDRLVDVQPARTVWHRWQLGDPAEPAQFAAELQRYQAGARGLWTHPYRWFVQPADVVTFGVFHFLVGVLVGWMVDARMFGPPTEREQKRRRPLHIWLRVLAQTATVLLLFNYLHKALLLIKPRYGVPGYEHDPVPAMDGGFAMSVGFAWTQRNLVARLGLLLGDP